MQRKIYDYRTFQLSLRFGAVIDVLVQRIAISSSPALDGFWDEV